MEFEEKFIGFIDILGFKSLVASAECGSGIRLPELMDLLNELGSKNDEEQISKFGPKICPGSSCIRKDMNFRVTQISDCAIVSSEISPAGAINLISHCWGAVINLLSKGIMCRGYITKGSVYHENGQIIGSGYNSAYDSESKVSAFKRDADDLGTPFVEVAPEIHEYILGETDECVVMMYKRMVKSDGGITALFPFQRLSHSFTIGGIYGEFNPDKEKESNNDIRKIIRNISDRVMSFVDMNNPKAVRKATHYIAALEEQLLECDKTDEAIDKLCAPAFGPGADH